MHNLRCRLGWHTWGYLIAPDAQSVTRHCIRCENPKAAAEYPAQLRLAATPDADPLAAAYDLVAAVAAADVPAANTALRHTTAAHVAAVALVCARGPRAGGDLPQILQMLAMQAQVDGIDTTPENSGPR
jgi:hypothetical protein